MWGQFNSKFFLRELELIYFELELKFPTNIYLNPQINLPFNLLIQKYFLICF